MVSVVQRWGAWRARFRRREVAAEAGALTAGTYLEHAVRCRAELAPWMALNAAAHGDLAHVRRAASRGRAAGAVSDVVSASRVIAAELLDAAGDDEELLVLLQRMLLVPLELDLLRVGESDKVTVGTVVSATRAVLGVRRV